jgi:glycosyltransferase involved in cell wall biosynthesis
MHGTTNELIEECEKMKKVSVIMPCHNDGKYINQSINCVKEQTYPNVELVVIDDGSTDHQTKEQLSRINYHDFQLLYTDHVRPAAARNYGIQHATGEYILPLDADDLIDKTYIEKAVAVLDKYDNIGAVYCQADKFGCERGYWDLPPYSRDKLLLDNIIFVTSLFRKSDWEKLNGFCESLVNGMEDYDFWLSILELGRDFYQIPEVLFHYRVKQHSRTTLFKKDRSIVSETYRSIYFRHKPLYQKYMDEYCLALRASLLDRINYIDMARKLSIGKLTESLVIRVAYKFPQLKRILKKVLLRGNEQGEEKT